MHTVIKLGKDRIMARIILGVTSVPLLMGMNYKESHADHAEVAMKCTRLGCKPGKSIDIKISRVIQGCIICKQQDEVFN